MPEVVEWIVKGDFADATSASLRGAAPAPSRWHFERPPVISDFLWTSVPAKLTGQILLRL